MCQLFTVDKTESVVEFGIYEIKSNGINKTYDEERRRAVRPRYTRTILITVGVKDQVWLVMFKKLVKLLIKVF